MAAQQEVSQELRLRGIERDVLIDQLLEERLSGRLARGTAVLIALCVAGFLFWASITRLDETAIAQGEIVPDGAVKTVQHLEGGIVADVPVSEGASVQAGDVLVRFDGASVTSELNRLRARQQALALEEERLRALVEQRAPDFSRFADQVEGALVSDQEAIFSAQRSSHASEVELLQRQLNTLREQLASTRREALSVEKRVQLLRMEKSMRERLAEQALGANLDVIRTAYQLEEQEGQLGRLHGEERRLQSQVRETQQRLVELGTRRDDGVMQKLGEVLNQSQEVQESIRGMADRVRRLVVYAPEDGIVNAIAFSQPGSVVPPGGVIAEIVPLGQELIVDAKIATNDIGFTRVGQPVHVKVETFNFARFGKIEGVLESISATTFKDDDGFAYYKGKIRLDKSYVGFNPAQKQIVPGMVVQADIKTGSKTLIEYLLKPIYTNIDESFRER